MNRPAPFLKPAQPQRGRRGIGQFDPVAPGAVTEYELVSGIAERAVGVKGLSRLQLLAIIFLSWTAVGLFQAISEMLTSSAWRAVLINKVVGAWAWALLTPPLMEVDRKLAARQVSIVRSLIIFLLLSVPVTLLNTLITAVLLYPFPEVSWSPLRNSDFTIFYFLGGWVAYGALVAVLQAYRFYTSYMTGQLQLERVQRSLLESRLDALRLHLEPHFLFNALNAISSEVAENPQTARNMIGDLGALLRRSLDCKDSAEISLIEEVTLLEHYLSIQKIRFGDRIEFEIDVEPEVRTARVPPMLVQPLVENAIRHGVEHRMSGGKITISGAKVGEELHIKVVDDGVGLPKGWRLESSTGHGLRITIERLAALYPETGENCLNIRRGERGGTVAVIHIPLRRTDHHDQQ